MTPKERVLATIAHREPDRVPVGEWGIDHDHVSRILGRPTYWRNRAATTVALWEGRRDEAVRGMIEDYAELVEKLDYDIVTVSLVPSKKTHYEDPPKPVGEGEWRDSRGNVYKYAASNDSISSMTHSEGIEELSDAMIESAMRRADSLDDSCFELLDAMVARSGGKRAILFRDLDIYGGLMGPFGGDFEHEMIVSATAGEEIRRLYEPAARYNQRLIDECVKRGVDILMAGHDFCMNSGPMISPAALRANFFPFMRLVNGMIAAKGLPSFLHCCGNTKLILEDFIEAGYRGYQSIQVSAGMSNEEIKRQYGDILTMWTGVQCETLIEGTPEDVEREVTESLRALMPGGGFIFGSTNSVQFGAKTENYLRALDIVREKGAYAG